MKPKYHQYLLDLTNLTSASGRETAVITYIKNWVKKNKKAKIKSDQYGNLLISPKIKPKSKNKSPLYITAHLDHPTFVVSKIINDKKLIAEFRGGVQDQYFLNTHLRLHNKNKIKPKGIITELHQPTKKQIFKTVHVEFKRPHHAAPNDLIPWDLPKSKIAKGVLSAPGCDDLAAVAVALALFEQVTGKTKPAPEVRLLFTLAEEVGFIGAIGACQSGIIPSNARILALENSKSMIDSPQGAGAIIRVGDASSIFNPELDNTIRLIATQLAKKDPTFKFQRKLMPGGSCEATAFQTYGYDATCLCLPLLNYHNMNEKTGKIDSEKIHVSDFDNLIKLLQQTVKQIDTDSKIKPLKQRLDQLFQSRQFLLK